MPGEAEHTGGDNMTGSSEGSNDTRTTSGRPSALLRIPTSKTPAPGDGTLQVQPRPRKKHKSHKTESQTHSWKQPLNDSAAVAHEKTEAFTLAVRNDLSLQQQTLLEHAENVQFLPVDNEERMLDSPLLERKAVSLLFKQKNRLNHIFDSGKSWSYYRARDQHFPQDASGSMKRRNRAGDKIAEADEHCSNSLRNACKAHGTFLDICGGPGAFSLYFLREGAAWGAGITLVDDGEWWYHDLLNHSRFCALYGSEGDGNGACVVMETLASEIMIPRCCSVDFKIKDSG